MRKALSMVSMIVLMMAAVAGCGGKDNAPAAARKVAKVEPPPPLKGEGFPWGKPPEAVVTVGGRTAGSTLASWCWPEDPNRMGCDYIPWPPKLPDTAVAGKDESVRLAVSGILVEPLSPIKLTVNPLEIYKQKERPSKPLPPADQYNFEKKDIKFKDGVMSVEYSLNKLKPGKYLLIFEIGWGVPVGGDATYLVPVEVR